MRPGGVAGVGARMTRADLPADLVARLDALHDEGQAIFERFERDVRSAEFHPFKPADYGAMVDMLLPFVGECRTFLEWGSATGVIAITADLLGFEAYGIEIDASLVDMAEDLARRHGSGARFAAGSLLPDGYEWRSPSGDPRLGTIETGESGYAKLGMSLDEFDLVYGYPWTGEAGMMLDIMERCGGDGARLLINRGREGIQLHRISHGIARPRSGTP
ncbi:MAG: hypothetical protein KFH98_14250 [Gemmatimonadetes bacterium]|nr:hypothetical protein [Gemmatimonadota bacterium]